MKNLNILLQEKLKINSKSKVINKDDMNFSKEECIVVPFTTTLYNIFIDEFSDCEIMSNSGPNIFVVRIEYLEEYKRLKTEGPRRQIDFMKIPDKYSSFEEVKKDYENGKLDLDELEKLNF